MKHLDDKLRQAQKSGLNHARPDHLEAGVGVAPLPRSTKAPDTLLRLMVEKLELNRTAYLYGVAGRQRTAVAATLMKMLRACDWSRYAIAA